MAVTAGESSDASCGFAAWSGVCSVEFVATVCGANAATSRVVIRAWRRGASAPRWVWGRCLRGPGWSLGEVYRGLRGWSGWHDSKRG
uniref:Uncharacterized protein n=1 Tax=Knipowitschia caucasica TaxID=637954 RepID=A0AAV2MK42_KNICA